MIWLEWAWLIPVFPLAAFPLILFFGGRTPRGGGAVAILAVGLSLLLSVLVAVEASQGGLPERGDGGEEGGVGGGAYESSMTWASIPGVGSPLEVGVLVDPLTCVMLIVVALVGWLVAVYSVGYMAREAGKPRYYAEISLFIGVMLGLVLASNLLLVFIFWELVGLCSYLLIGFWYTRPEAAAAAKKAFIVTRVGDVLFLVGIITIYNHFGTLSFTGIQEQLRGELGGGTLDVQALTTMALLVFGGAVGKSAQFPLHVWLPDAMEGPTTVSALIHAATMVNAGVYLVARSYFLFEHAPDALLAVAWIGGVTALMAASMALVSNDIKRVLAYSTISQLGYMMLALGVGGYSASMFHLQNHAFFKALLFLCAGSVIHSMETNDMRLMGGLGGRMRLTSLTMLVGVLAITGVVPFSGFWSKDEIIVSVFRSGNWALLSLAVITALLTALYMFRLWLMTFTGEPRSREARGAHESPPVMTAPLLVLAALAVGSGFIGTPLWPSFQGFIHWGELGEEPFGPASAALMALSLIMAVAGALAAVAVYRSKKISPARLVSTGAGRAVHRLLVERYYIDHIYYAFAERVVHALARLCDAFDLRVIDGAVNAISDRAARAGERWRRSATGNVQHYAVGIVAGLCMLMLLLWLVLPPLTELLGGWPGLSHWNWWEGWGW
ncbi:MAG: NADH-quinone oxidoreductase subunit L [Thermoplasmatota archaeon]